MSEVKILSDAEVAFVSGGNSERDAYNAGYRAGEAVGEAIEAVGDAVRNAYNTVVGWFS